MYKLYQDSFKGAARTAFLGSAIKAASLLHGRYKSEYINGLNLAGIFAANIYTASQQSILDALLQDFGAGFAYYFQSLIEQTLLDNSVSPLVTLAISTGLAGISLYGLDKLKTYLETIQQGVNNSPSQNSAPGVSKQASK